jgi:transcriptional regulator with XRE-family HTH domain
MDMARLAMDWLRAIRGKRSQRAFSKRLGYRSNIAYRWESGACFPTAAQTFALAKCSGAMGRDALARFYGARPAWLEGVDLATREGVARVLSDLRGKARLLELARRSGYSRFSISRWLSGAAEPRLPEMLAVIDAASFRVLDFVSQFVRIETLPSVAEEWRVLQAARRAAYDVPWSHAVLRVLELTDYQKLHRHRPGWIAKRLGISREEEERCLACLASARQIHKQRGLWRIETTQTVDTGADAARARKLKGEWLKVGLSRLEAGAKGTFAYNLMAVSHADYERLRELHAAYFRAMQALVAESAPSERVVLFNTELFALDTPPE